MECLWIIYNAHVKKIFNKYHLMQQMMAITRTGKMKIQSRIGIITWVGLATQNIVNKPCT